MANYLIQSCDEVTSYVVDSGLNTIVIGNLYYFTFTGGTTPICGTVISEDNINPINDGINSVTEYQNCLECLQNNDFSFFVTGCTLPESGPVNANQFGVWPIGKFYSLCATNNEFEGCSCFEVIDIIPSGYTYNFVISGPYSDCDCQGPPRSANTETDLCIEICTPEGGKTVVSVNPPHPVWTDGYGTKVTELNMITLGGQNGLNN